MKRKNFKGIVLLVAFILVIVIYYSYDTWKTEKITNHLKEEYPSINFDENISASITNIYHGNPRIFRNNPHHAFLILDGSLKKRIVASYELSTKLTLDEVLEKGELLEKDSGSCVFHIFKFHSGDTSKFEFEIQNDQGYPLK